MVVVKPCIIIVKACAVVAEGCAIVAARFQAARAARMTAAQAAGIQSPVERRAAASRGFIALSGPTPSADCRTAPVRMIRVTTVRKMIAARRPAGLLRLIVIQPAQTKIDPKVSGNMMQKPESARAGERRAIAMMSTSNRPVRTAKAPCASFSDRPHLPSRGTWRLRGSSGFRVAFVASKIACALAA